MDRQDDQQNESNGAAAEAETVVHAIAKKVGSTVGAVASKVVGKSGERGTNGDARAQSHRAGPQAERDLARRKQKKTAHRRRLRAGHAKG